MGCSSSIFQRKDISSCKSSIRQPKQTEKTNEKQRGKVENERFLEILQFLLKLPLMTRIPRDKYPLVAASCCMEEFPAKATICSQGDIFALIHGCADAYVQFGQSKARFELGEGDCFGRIHSRLVMEVVTVVPVTCMRIPKGVLEELGFFDASGQNANVNNIQSFGEFTSPEICSKRMALLKAIGPCRIFKKLLIEETLGVAAALTERSFSEGESIVTQGEYNDSVYAVYDGHLEGAETLQIFGDHAFLFQEPQPFTVKVMSRTATALMLHYDQLSLLDVFASVLKQVKLHTFIRYSDLRKLGLLGAGGFSKVLLCENVKAPVIQTFALKSMCKGYIHKTGMVKSIQQEMDALMMTNSPFIIKLHQTYNKPGAVCFLLEAALGGDLYAIFHRKGFHGSECHTKYYIASWVYALQHMHARNIIFRDVKPENAVLDSCGNLKVVDFGIAKFTMGKTFTTCGTPDYFPPEVISGTGHTKAYDWWGIGIMLFEFMAGYPPFDSACPMQIYSKVMRGFEKVHRPKALSDSLYLLCKQMLQKDPNMRLPTKQGGVDNIKDCKWFTHFDWQGLENRTLTPPYIPEVKHAKDLKNISARKEDCPKVLPVDPDVDDLPHWKYFDWLQADQQGKRPYTCPEVEIRDEDNPDEVCPDVEWDNLDVGVDPAPAVPMKSSQDQVFHLKNFCICGNENRAHAKFCDQCGSKLTESNPRAPLILQMLTAPSLSTTGSGSEFSLPTEEFSSCSLSTTGSSSCPGTN
eukprot:gnl/MRDRNA2_/MRDRNA2_14312_c0_seq1.p1 gnl/MRDRNA2_/MRDRNA2_14312_c0~~gnl/MRDRNA2_/MRDRNA2_14312_c0_seq1.p1  ORF type:complete len:750 (+),score=130.84 gnl/MRDRNA2_/MRDRNA2_14312_c0_seq1:117-2366(+)